MALRDALIEAYYQGQSGIAGQLPLIEDKHPAAAHAAEALAMLKTIAKGDGPRANCPLCGCRLQFAKIDADALAALITKMEGQK